MTPSPGTVRLAVIDTDSSFVHVLAKRLEAAGWEHRLLTSTVPLDELVAMKLNALVIDPGALGLDGLGLPRAGLHLAARPGPDRGLARLDGRPAGQGPAHGRRRLGLQALPPRGGPGPGRGRCQAPQARPGRHARRARSWPASSRSARTSSRPSSPGGASTSPAVSSSSCNSLAEANGKVLEREEIYQRVWGYTMAHGDRSVDVFIRKLRSKLQKASSEWAYVHTHFGVGYRFEAEPADGDAGGARRSRWRAGDRSRGAAAPRGQSGVERA